MSELRDEKLKETIRQKASEFLEKESNGAALITVTGLKLADKSKTAEILFTVFPAEKENDALDFAKRKRGEFREFLRIECDLRPLPFVDFKIDLGEKNRQKIDTLSELKEKT